MMTSKQSVGSGGQGGDNGDDVDPRGDDYNDTTISLAMATATRVAGDKECDGGMSDGDDEKGLRASDDDGAEESDGGGNEGGG